DWGCPVAFSTRSHSSVPGSRLPRGLLPGEQPFQTALHPVPEVLGGLAAVCGGPPIIRFETLAALAPGQRGAPDRGHDVIIFLQPGETNAGGSARVEDQ